MTEAQRSPTSDVAPKAEPGVGGLVQRIGGDLKAIAEDQLALARLELIDGLKEPLADAVAIVLGGVLAIIGLGLACATAVVALEPLIEPLWARMLIMSVVYMACGAIVAGVYIKQLRSDAPSMARTKREASRTVEAIKAEVTNDANEPHTTSR